MSARESLNSILDRLPDEKIDDVLKFAEFISWRQEQSAWSKFGKAQLAKAYGPDEPEYSVDDLKGNGRT